jgi:hypothetical protein
MPAANDLGHKAELSSLSAQTKLMPLRYNDVVPARLVIKPIPIAVLSLGPKSWPTATISLIADPAPSGG